MIATKSIGFSPTAGSIRKIGMSFDDVNNLEHNKNSWLLNYYNVHKNRLAIDLDLVEMFCNKNTKILEVGSTPPILTIALNKSGYNVEGIDIDPNRYSKILQEEGVIVKRCNIEHDIIPYDDNYFDAVLFNEVFEHLRINPIFTLNEIKRIMKPDGVLLLSTPNLRSLKGLINILVYNKVYSCADNVYSEYQKLDTLGHMGHVREYMPKEVSEFLKQIGFDVEEVIYRGKYRKPFVNIISYLFPSLRQFVTFVSVKR